MQLRLSLMLCAGLVLACTVTSNDDTAGTETGAGTSDMTDTTGTSGTSGPATTSATAGSSGAAESGGATEPDPTTAGSAEETGATESSGGAEEAGTGETGAGGVSFTEVYEQIIMPKGCNSGYCHGGGAGGLTMTDEATSYANLVDMVATTPVCGQGMRVVPGSIDESIVWYRVRPAALDDGNPCAPKMPQGSMGLTEPEAQLVDDWIAGGALE